MWSLFLASAHSKVNNQHIDQVIVVVNDHDHDHDSARHHPLLLFRALPADHGVRDVREAFDPLERAEDKTVLLLQLLQR